MGECLSWVLGLLLPSLWEAEVAVSAAALLVAVLVLFLLSDQHSKPTAATSSDSSASSPHSSTTASCHGDAGRGRSCARGKAIADISCARGAGGYAIKVVLLHVNLSTAQ